MRILKNSEIRNYSAAFREDSHHLRDLSRRPRGTQINLLSYCWLVVISSVEYFIIQYIILAMDSSVLISSGLFIFIIK